MPLCIARIILALFEYPLSGCTRQSKRTAGMAHNALSMHPIKLCKYVNVAHGTYNAYD